MSKLLSLRTAALVTALSFALAACGGSPTATDSGAADPDLAAVAAETTAALAAINEQLEGLDAEARRAELIELAQAEGGEVSFYGSTNPEDVDPVLSAFEDQTGLTVNNYRASSASVQQRIQEEASAGFVGADVTVNDPPEIQSLVDSGLLASFSTPVSEDIHEGGVTEYAIDVFRALRIVLWNTDRLTPDQYPTSWEDVLENHPGDVILDPTDWDWFATFTQQYLMGEKGMTEQEAIDYWMSVAPNTVVISGHTLGTQLVTSGEYAISAVTYQHALPPEGAPVAWEPPLWPVIENSTKICILGNTEHPASALLLTEFFVTDGQAILSEGGRSPANVTVPSSWPEEYNALTVDIDTGLFTDPGEMEKWQGYYEQVLALAGQAS